MGLIGFAAALVEVRIWFATLFQYSERCLKIAAIDRRRGIWLDLNQPRTQSRQGFRGSRSRDGISGSGTPATRSRDSIACKQAGVIALFFPRSEPPRGLAFPLGYTNPAAVS
jgi:hypothetical protein